MMLSKLLLCLTFDLFTAAYLFSFFFFSYLLLQNFTIFGYGRSIMTDEELRNMISKTLTCRVDKRCYFIVLCLK